VAQVRIGPGRPTELSSAAPPARSASPLRQPTEKEQPSSISSGLGNGDRLSLNKPITGMAA